jgi:type II secretory pathway pseudopilin PulG
MLVDSERSSAGCSGWMRRDLGLSGFSLVEVVIAIAVASVMLIAILGLMAYAAQTVQQSDKYARLSTVASQALANVETMQLAATPYYNNGYPATNYYNFEGLPTNSGIIATSVYYQCIISTNTPSASGFNYAPQEIVVPLQMVIRWPAPGYANTNIIVTSVLNYDSL